MKKLLNAAEWLGWAVAIVGLGARWSLVTGGGFMLIIGLSLLSMIYFLRANFSVDVASPDPVDALRVDRFGNDTTPSPAAADSSFLLDLLLPKVIGLAGAVVFIGMLFKLMSWTGSRIMLTVGVGTMFTVVVILILNQRINGRAVLLTVLGGLLLYISSDTLVRQFHRDDPVLVEKMIYRDHHPRDRAAAEAVRQHLKLKRAQR